MAEQTAWIFCNGDRLGLEAVRSMVRPGDFLIAVDGGLRYLRALGFLPTLVIGDLDSADPAKLERMLAQGIVVRRFPVDKNETDLELAVEEALTAGYRKLRIAAAIGGRVDMTLANINLLLLPALEGLDARLEDGFDEIFLIRPGEPGTEIEGQAGEIVSLLPVNGPAHGVVTEALAYPLKNETLYPERTRGISNRMESTLARVRLAQGLLLCIHTHNIPEEKK